MSRADVRRMNRRGRPGWRKLARGFDRLGREALKARAEWITLRVILRSFGAQEPFATLNNSMY